MPIKSARVFLESEVLIHFDGWGPEYDYWCSAWSLELHPPGWCRTHNWELQTPLRELEVGRRGGGEGEGRRECGGDKERWRKEGR